MRVLFIRQGSMDCWCGDRVVDLALACCGKEAAEPKGKGLDVGVNLHLYLYLWP